MLRFLSPDIWIGFSFTELASKRKEKTHHRPISLILRRKEQKVGKEKNSENKPMGPSSNSWYLWLICVCVWTWRIQLYALYKFPNQNEDCEH